MKHLITACLLLWGSGTTASAQKPRLDPDDTVAVQQLASRLTTRLLEGIAVDSAQARQARKLVLSTLNVQLRLPLDTSDPYEVYFRLQRKRDHAVRALLKSAKARRQFDRNAAALMPSWAPTRK